jgi:hypothetical protein
MQIKYKIIEVSPDYHSFVVRYYTDKLSEEHLCVQFEEDGTTPLLTKDGVIGRCRYDLNISLYKTPAPTGEDLHEKIMLHVPDQALSMEEDLISETVDTSLSHIPALLGVVRDDDPIFRASEVLRTKRNRLLTSTDFYALSDVTMTAEMTEYRQLLRDLPANTEDVFNPIYPEKP